MAFHTRIAQISGNPIYTAVSEAMLGWLKEYHTEMLIWTGRENVTLGEHGFATQMAYNAAKFPEGLKNWSDFFNVEKFPGNRSLQRHAARVLAIALLADGVPADQLFPYDLDRAFASLDRIKDHALAATDPQTSPALQAINEKLVAQGVRIIGRIYRGDRHISSNFPVKTPADLAGKPFRAVPLELWVSMALQGLAIGLSGWNWTISEAMLGTLADGQPPMGAGAVLAALVFVFIFAFGLAERGVMKGDAFAVASISLLVFLVAVFVFYPVGSMITGMCCHRSSDFNRESIWMPFISGMVSFPEITPLMSGLA